MIGLATVKKCAAKYGATIDAPPGDSVIYCDAPKGSKWDASDCHVICAAWDDGNKRDALAFAVSEMRYGLVECDCEDCAS